MIYLGSDHGGYKLKIKIKKWLLKWGFEYEDLGNLKLERGDDYPDYASKVAVAVGLDKKSKGIVVCRSGVGVDVVANKFKGIRSVLGIKAKQVKAAVKKDGVNVLSIAADYTSDFKVKKMVKVFLKTKVSQEERHLRRIEKISKLEV